MLHRLLSRYFHNNGNSSIHLPHVSSEWQVLSCSIQHVPLYGPVLLSSLWQVYQEAPISRVVFLICSYFPLQQVDMGILMTCALMTDSVFLHQSDMVSNTWKANKRLTFETKCPFLFWWQQFLPQSWYLTSISYQQEREHPLWYWQALWKQNQFSI